MIWMHKLLVVFFCDTVAPKPTAEISTITLLSSTGMDYDIISELDKQTYTVTKLF